ncbi:MAG: hypothetical protein AB7I38_05245 [Dehalococcoidia bacterium]
MTGDRLGEVIRTWRRARSRPPAGDVHEQLQYLERDVQEVRTRVNALFFTVLAAALGDVAGRLFG